MFTNRGRARVRRRKVISWSRPMAACSTSRTKCPSAVSATALPTHSRRAVMVWSGGLGADRSLVHRDPPPLTSESAPVATARTLLRNGLSEDAIVGYLTRTWPFDDTACREVIEIARTEQTVSSRFPGAR
jgi:hypothetical protein